MTIGRSFDGVGTDIYIPCGSPPDANGAVGTTQYFQWVNKSFAIFDKQDGHVIYGPADGNILFQNLGSNHPCALNNAGDPIAQYDKLVGRWVVSQLAVFAQTGGFLDHPFECIAVSTTDDATGAYNIYAFQYD